MQPTTATIMTASAIGAAAGVPISEPCSKRLAAFWKSSERFADPDFEVLFADLLSKIAGAEHWLQDLVAGEAAVPRRHVKALHDRLMKSGVTSGPTRLCQPDFDWLV